tara:strand:+ start:300 stop:503 length:204 start_codon:yes stop_codon:yes gene_type:complete
MKDWIRVIDKKFFNDFKRVKFSRSYQDFLLGYIFLNITIKNNATFCLAFESNIDSFETENPGINLLN